MDSHGIQREIQEMWSTPHPRWLARPCFLSIFRSLCCCAWPPKGQSYYNTVNCSRDGGGCIDLSRDSIARPNTSTGRVDRNWTESGGKAPKPGFLLVGELAKVHTTRRRGHLRVAISTVPGPSGSARVDMLTSPVAAARAAVATGAWVKSKHMYLIRGSVGA